MTKSYQDLINKTWREGSAGAKVPVIDPATEEAFAEVIWGTPEDASLALEAAEKALSGEWSKWSPTQRGRFLVSVAGAIRENVADLAMLLSREQGKPLHQASAEVEDAARYLEYYGGLADKLTGMTVDLGPGQLDYVLREPLGVTVHIAPWNYPLDIFCRSIAPALAAGNTCVIKPAEEITLVSLALASLFQEGGLPEGVLSVIPGSGLELGKVLIEDPRVRGLVFTGSVETGRAVLKAAARNITPVISMELGGKCPALVFVKDAADLEGAVNSAAGALVWNAGQSCGQRSRWYVQRNVYDTFLEQLAERVGKLKPGPGTQPGVDLGPLASKKHYDKVMSYIQVGIEEGARLIAGGRPTRRDWREGLFCSTDSFCRLQQ
jgi:aldehyde dehydrogenase (NAD+)